MGKCPCRLVSDYPCFFSFLFRIKDLTASPTVAMIMPTNPPTMMQEANWIIKG
ncbi:MAG: hypothetical protein HFI06_12540 [Eubacterium sp.]|nr:hypothetical protein [Eubacterium sp.]